MIEDRPTKVGKGDGWNSTQHGCRGPRVMKRFSGSHPIETLRDSKPRRERGLIDQVVGRHERRESAASLSGLGVEVLCCDHDGVNCDGINKE